jgi:hypothetical protein
LRADKGRRDQRQARNWQGNATTPKAAKVIQSTILIFSVEDKSECIE